MSLFTNTEIIIIASVLGFLMFLVIILSISIFFERKKHIELDEDIDNNVELEEMVEKPVIEKVEEPEETKKVVVEETKEEVKPVTEPLIMEFEEDLEVNKPISNVIDSKEKAELELLKIEEELTKEPNLEDTISNIEMAEEEEAIISYQELLQKTQELNIITTDSGDEPITIQEAFEKFETEDDNVAYVSPISSFESSTENLNEIQLENTANLEKLDKEIRKTNEFLTILNDLKKNLD